MIDLVPLLKIIPIFTLALMSPGPDFMAVSSMALSRGRAAGCLAALGIALGTTIYTLLSVFGLGIVFSHLHWLMIAVRVSGGCYLVYLGYQLWKGSLQPQSGDTVALPGAMKKRNPFMVGFLTNITNPKCLAFFASIFALTLPSNASGATQAAIVVLVGTMAAVWFGIVTLALSTPTMRKLYLRWSRWIDRVTGTFLAVFGLKLIFSGRN
jgi:threonine efflux protein